MRMCCYGHMYDNFKMALFKYFKRTPAALSLPTKLDSLSEAQLQKVNELKFFWAHGQQPSFLSLSPLCRDLVDFHFPEHTPILH